VSVAALLYLVTPCLLYLTSFVKPVLGWPLAAGMVALTMHAAIHWKQVPGRSRRLPFRPDMVLCVVSSVGILALMGFATGHYCWDWIKHWALLNSLESQPWPVELNLQGVPGYLRFYVGAYLVPAGLAHATGWNIAACTALWYGLGLMLAFKLLSRDAKGDDDRLQFLWVIPLLLCMAGADAWLQVLLRAESRPITFTGFHSEWWAGALLDHPPQYSSLLSLLLWVPHQAVPAFIAVGLLRHLRTAEALGPTALAVSTLALWSPYALIGIVLLLVPHVLVQPALRLALRRPEWAVCAAALVACAFAVLMAWTLSHEMPAGGFCLSCAPERVAQPGPYLVFLAVELAIPLLLLKRRLFDDATSIAALATLAVLPWIGGAVPDAVMRISMPALIYLFARCAREVVQRPPGRMAASAALVLALGGPTVWGEASFHVEAGSRHAALPARDPLRAPSYTVWAQRTTYSAREFFEICGWQWYPQYFATTTPPSWPSAAASIPTR
jgi:hypothetical protein